MLGIEWDYRTNRKVGDLNTYVIDLAFRTPIVHTMEPDPVLGHLRRIAST